MSTTARNTHHRSNGNSLVNIVYSVAPVIVLFTLIYAFYIDHKDAINLASDIVMPSQEVASGAMNSAVWTGKMYIHSEEVSPEEAADLVDSTSGCPKDPKLSLFAMALPLTQSEKYGTTLHTPNFLAMEEEYLHDFPEHCLPSEEFRRRIWLAAGTLTNIQNKLENEKVFKTAQTYFRAGEHPTLVKGVLFPEGDYPGFPKYAKLPVTLIESFRKDINAGTN
ncbi:hypothetical protein K493DRAFT_303131 [Basidiobolus meristosporus CBS 931.73]|uniref:Uncharacterized protein n=1 Tax=Basidiobolus meristosporus CBS 931.73 TaxID=1314790 RepID=A0A1Y1Y578_9FUNG|nr:hypothetical protein K493DRAFT_303131 [Basidiobolus meristosporus CBS 931.73]|eukprot:ORX92764.1 hypothetical protein K493DRAFT_303131 [Basidiobolus meristosporus CBS 931.73]